MAIGCITPDDSRLIPNGYFDIKTEVLKCCCKFDFGQVTFQLLGMRSFPDEPKCAPRILGGSESAGRLKGSVWDRHLEVVRILFEELDSIDLVIV